jgi:hypothetical protein
VSDERVRKLEASARRGDPAAQAALARARERTAVQGEPVVTWTVARAVVDPLRRNMRVGEWHGVRREVPVDYGDPSIGAASRVRLAETWCGKTIWTDARVSIEADHELRVESQAVGNDGHLTARFLPSCMGCMRTKRHREVETAITKARQAMHDRDRQENTRDRWHERPPA